MLTGVAIGKHRVLRRVRPGTASLKPRGAGYQPAEGSVAQE